MMKFLQIQKNMTSFHASRRNFFRMPVAVVQQYTHTYWPEGLSLTLIGIFQKTGAFFETVNKNQLQMLVPGTQIASPV